MSPISNSSSNATFLGEFPKPTRFENLEHDTMATLSILLSGLANTLFILSGVMWAAIQRKIVSRLTAPLAEMRRSSQFRQSSSSNRGSISDNRCHESNSEDGDEIKNESRTRLCRSILLFILSWVLHFSMYCGYVNRSLPIGSPVTQAIIISSFPLAVPNTFYSKWPVLSTGLLICWGQLWLQDVHWWLIGTLPLMHS